MSFVVKARVERQIDPDTCNALGQPGYCSEVVDLGPFETPDESEFDAEDTVWEDLEEQGEHVLTVWTEAIA